MDVVSFPSTKEAYRIIFNKQGKLSSIKIDGKEASQKICKIVGKTPIKGGKIQLNLFDSRNIIIDKNDYSVGDSLLIEVPSQKIISHFKLEKGASIILTAGKHISMEGKIENSDGEKIIFKNKDNESTTTSKKYAFVVGKEKAAIKVM